MPTISSGNSASGSFGVIDSVTISTRGTARIESPTGTRVQEFSGTRTFGPYSSQTYTITAVSGDLAYEIGDGTQSDAQALQALVSGFGKSGRPQIGVFGDSISGYYNTLSGICSNIVNNGDGTATISFAATLGLQVGDTIGVVGASDVGFNVIETPITAISGAGPYNYTYTLSGTPTASSDGANASLVYRFRKYQAGFAAWAQVLLKQDAKYINLGVGGDTFAKMLARFDRDVTSRAATLSRLVIMAGVNDVFSAGRTLAQVKVDAAAVFDRAKQLGIPVDLVTPPPQQNNRGGWTTGKRDIYRDFRNWLIQIAPSYNFGVIDSWTASAGSSSAINPTDTDLQPNSNVLFDAVHPGNLGAFLIGQKLATYHRTFVPRSDRLTASTSEANLIAGLFQGAGGSNSTTGGSGTVATGWTVSSTAGTPAVAASVNARTIANDGDVIGNNQRMAITFGANNDTVRLASASFHASVANGDSFRVSCTVKLSATGCGFVKGLYLYVLSQTATTGNLQFYDLAYTSSSGSNMPDGFDGVFELDCYVRTPQATHGAPSSVVAYIEVIGSGAGTSTVDIGRFTAVKVQ